MTRADIEALVAEVRRLHADPESAHAAEDTLMVAVLEAIARCELIDIGTAQAAELALSTGDVAGGVRWVS